MEFYQLVEWLTNDNVTRLSMHSKDGLTLISDGSALYAAGGDIGLPQDGVALFGEVATRMMKLHELWDKLWSKKGRENLAITPYTCKPSYAQEAYYPPFGPLSRIFHRNDGRRVLLNDRYIGLLGEDYMNLDYQVCSNTVFVKRGKARAAIIMALDPETFRPTPDLPPLPATQSAGGVK